MHLIRIYYCIIKSYFLGHNLDCKPDGIKRLEKDQVIRFDYMLIFY